MRQELARLQRVGTSNSGSYGSAGTTQDVVLLELIGEGTVSMTHSYLLALAWACMGSHEECSHGVGAPGAVWGGGKVSRQCACSSDLC